MVCNGRKRCGKFIEGNLKLKRMSDFKDGSSSYKDAIESCDIGGIVPARVGGKEFPNKGSIAHMPLCTSRTIDIVDSNTGLPSHHSQYDMLHRQNGCLGRLSTITFKHHFNEPCDPNIGSNDDHFYDKWRQ